MEYSTTAQFVEATVRTKSSLRPAGSPRHGAWLPNGKGSQHLRSKSVAEPSAAELAAVAAVAAAAAAAAAEAEADVRLNALETTFSGLEATVGGLQASFDDFAVQQVASRVALTRLLEKLAL